MAGRSYEPECAENGQNNVNTWRYLYLKGMASNHNNVKQLTLHDIRKLIDALGSIAESTMCTHSLALILNQSGEAIFTSSGWRLLDEAGISCPLGKFISRAAKNYTSFCGEDCKYFLFILKEIFHVIYHKMNKDEDMNMRKDIIKQIYSIKQILPCIFNCIRNTSGCHENDLLNFAQNLQSVVLTFMLSRFSPSVSKILSNLVCEFVQSICEVDSLKPVLEYVISHFDIFCCKIFSPLSESKVLKGFLFSANSIQVNVNLENVNFIIVWDLKMKAETEKVTWNIKDDSFMSLLNPVEKYQYICDNLKAHSVSLIISPTSCDKNLKSRFEKNNIFLFDNLVKEEIENILYSYQIYPLGDLNDLIEAKHIGVASTVKSLFFKKSSFLHLMCSNSGRFLNVCHILLCAPFNAMWVEYYSEILHCFKMILQWLSPASSSCFQKKNVSKLPVENQLEALHISSDKSENCDLCSKIKIKFKLGNQHIDHLSTSDPNGNTGTLLPPCSWELMFRTAIDLVMGDLNPSCCIMAQALHFSTLKSICKRANVPFIAVKNLEKNCDDFLQRCNTGEVRFLEPVVCKEIMMNDILDLILQLLKVDCIVSVK